MKIIYNPEAGFWQGVPARDLSTDEWQALEETLQQRLIEIGMYKVIITEKKNKRDGE